MAEGQPKPVYPYDPAQPVDKEAGITQYGDEDLFLQMVLTYEDLTLDAQLTDLHQGLLNKDFIQIQDKAHNLKGTSGYVAALHFSETNNKLQIIIKEKITQLSGGKKQLNQELTSEEIIEVYRLSIQSLERARDLKIYIAKLDNREYDVSLVEKYISDVKPILEELEQKEFAQQPSIREDQSPPTQCNCQCAIF